jgi:serine protease Do
MAKTISAALIDKGEVIRGYMGVNIQDITPDMAKSLKLKNTSGVIVADVMPGGPADKAGIAQGDIVLRYNGTDIKNVAQLRNLVASTKPGSTVPVKVLGEKGDTVLTVKVGDLARAQASAKTGIGGGLLGVSVEKVTPQVAKELGLSKTAGVVISGVAPGSAAQQAGLQKGDVVFRVNNTPVNDPKEFDKLISRAAEGGGALLLVRDVNSGNVGYLSVPLNKG